MKKLIHTATNGHKVYLVGLEQTSNGGLVCVLHCCGDPSTEHRHNLYHAQELNGVVVHGLDQKPILDKLAGQVAPDLAVQHESMQAAVKFFNDMSEEPDEREKGPHMKLLD